MLNDALMKRFAWPLLLAAAACSSPNETSSVTLPNSKVGSHITVLDGGVADASRAFVITMVDEVDPAGLECDAIVLAPNLLMTARHCVANVDETKIVPCNAGIAGSSPSISADYDVAHFGFFADGPLAHRFSVHAASIVDDAHPDLCGADIAFVVLDGNLPDDVPISTLAPSSEAANVGDTLSVVGWGTTSAATSLDSNVLLERDGVSVTALGPTMVQGPTKKDAVYAGELATTLGFCNGDSGGPALDAKGHVVGIVSRAVHSCDTGPDVYTSPQAHFDLAAKAFAAAGAPFDPDGTASSDDAGTPSASSDAPPSASSGCSTTKEKRDGGSWLAIAFAALVVVSRRRRRAG